MATTNLTTAGAYVPADSATTTGDYVPSTSTATGAYVPSGTAASVGTYVPSTSTAAGTYVPSGTAVSEGAYVPSETSTAITTPANYSPAATTTYETLPYAPDAAIPETLRDATYVPGFLRSQIGKTVRVEFYIGSSMTDRVGILADVGASYILLREFSGAATIMCDLFSIKFVTIVDDNSGAVIIQ